MLRYIIPRNPKILFVGINPHFGSYRRGVPFSNNKTFWYLLNRSGLIKEDMETLRNDVTLRKFYTDKFGKAYGYGFINIIYRPTVNTAALRKGEEKAGIRRITNAIRRKRPRIECFIGKINYEKFSGSKRFALGLQRRRICGSRVFVASFPIRGPAATRIREFKALGRIARIANEA